MFAGLKVIVSALRGIGGIFHKYVTIVIAGCTDFPKV